MTEMFTKANAALGASTHNEAFEKGYCDYFKNRKKLENPYMNSDVVPHRDAWDNGWEAAMAARFPDFTKARERSSTRSAPSFDPLLGSGGRPSEQEDDK